MSNTGRFGDNAVALVTGASRGIGKAIATRLAQDGVLLRGVQMGKVDLPPDYRAGMEKMLEEEMENDKMKYTLALKDQQVKQSALEAEAERALGELKQVGRGRIAIGASRTIGAYMLPPVLAAFHRLHPEVELSLQVENTQLIEAKLLAGDIDIGFAEGTANGEHLDYTVFARDHLVLIAAPRPPLAARSPLPLSALAGQRLLMHEEGSGTRAVTELALQAKQLQIRPAMTLASSEAIKQTVATGTGLAFLSSAAIRSEVEAGTLVVLEVRGMRIQRPLYRVQPHKARPSPSLKAFLELLDAYAASNPGAPPRRTA